MKQTNILNDISLEMLKNSSSNRENQIKWSSLKLFRYSDQIHPTGLDGWSYRILRVRIGIHPDKNKPQRPVAVFYKQKRGRIRIEEAYYLNDEEVAQFQAKFQTLH